MMRDFDSDTKTDTDILIRFDVKERQKAVHVHPKMDLLAKRFNELDQSIAKERNKTKSSKQRQDRQKGFDSKDSSEFVITGNNGEEIELNVSSKETVVDDSLFAKDRRYELRMFNDSAVLIYSFAGKFIGKGRMQNLSFSGLSVNCNCLLNIGDKLRVEVVGNKDLPAFQAVVAVVRLGDYDNSAVGLNFIEKSELANRVLHEFVLKN